MDAIDKLIDDVIGREGGYSNHPSDTGGETMWGITKRVAVANGYTGEMKALPRERAAAIYRMQYFTRPGFDRVMGVYPRVAEKMFDMGVNMGPGVPSGFLQRALNALNRQAKDYPDIGVDGDVGGKTIASLRAFKAKRGAEGGTVLVTALAVLQGERYISLAEGRSANEDFLYGWLAHRVKL